MCHNPTFIIFLYIFPFFFSSKSIIDKLKISLIYLFYYSDNINYLISNFCQQDTNLKGPIKTDEMHLNKNKDHIFKTFFQKPRHRLRH